MMRKYIFNRMHGNGIKILLSCCLLFAACKKSDIVLDEIDDPVVSPTTGTRHEFTLDSIFLYARQLYLWQEALPDYATFAPRDRYASIVSSIPAYRQELADITQYAIDPLSGNPYEWLASSSSPRYSYLTEQNSGSSVTAAIMGSGAANPVSALSVFEVGQLQVGYIALASFPLLSNCKAVLDESFATLAGLGVTTMVVDLRNNRGGYVETAAYVANLLAPSSINGKVMYSERFNTLMQSGKATILKYQPYLDSNGKTVMYNGRPATMADVNYAESANTTRFEKTGPLEGVAQLYFIVSGNTASASELLISAMKPHLPVTLVGQTTYGKPVGFFPVNIDGYSIYLASFSLHNAEGWGDYYQGMPVDIPVTMAANAALGDPEEAALKATLSKIGGTSSVVKLTSTVKHSYPSSASVLELKWIPEMDNRPRDLKE